MSKMTFTEMLRHLDQTWREQPRVVRVLAARYYIGAETMESLRELTRARPCHGFMFLPPVLTERQAEYIIEMR